MDNERLNYMKTPVKNDFGISKDKVVSYILSRKIGRFYRWCDNDESKVRAVLDRSESLGVSATFFLIHEYTEGYSAPDGWWNAVTNSNASYLDEVNRTINQIATHQDSGLAWYDVAYPFYQGPPQDVRIQGQAFYDGLDHDTVGTFYLAGTAAATWSAFYPDALNASVNRVQNYGDPFGDGIDLIKYLGGSITGEKGGSHDPQPQPGPNPTNSLVGTYQQVSDTLLVSGDKKLSKIHDNIWAISGKTVYGVSDENLSGSGLSFVKIHNNLWQCTAGNG